MDSNARNLDEQPRADGAAKRGIVLLNLGTPDAPEPPEVRRYLGQFLMDKYVVDIPAPLRWMLVHGIILRTRPEQSAHAYKKVWTDRGSPLLVHHLDLTAKVREALAAQGDDRVVVPAMRYGNPSLEAALEALAEKGVSDVTVVPLYPQFSDACTTSSIEETRAVAAKVLPDAKLTFLPEFYDRPEFLDAFAAATKEPLAAANADFVLFSFHGLPERQVQRADPSGQHCLKVANCCDVISDVNRHCYRAQCFATARALAERHGLPKEKWAVSFQSRLGRAKWIGPATDAMYESLAKQGVKRLAVLCPAFVADCLETLEEIAIRGDESFREHGGEKLVLIPSMNAHPKWVAGLVALL